MIKSSSFLSRVRDSSSSRITKSSSSSSTSKNNNSSVPGSAGLKSSSIKKDGAKKRRPKNKIASLDSLADALPDLLEDEGGDVSNLGKVKHRSLKTKRGALKKKEMVVKGEMERFGASMAKLTETPAQQTEAKDTAMTTEAQAAQPATSDRWAALRGYISTTMEQNPAFAKKS